MVVLQRHFSYKVFTLNSKPRTLKGSEEGLPGLGSLQAFGGIGHRRGRIDWRCSQGRNVAFQVKRGLPKIRGTRFGGPIIRIFVLGGPILGSPILEHYHM